MTDYDNHKIAVDAINADKFVVNGISTPNAMHSIASSIIYLAPSSHLSPVSFLAATKARLF